MRDVRQWVKPAQSTRRVNPQHAASVSSTASSPSPNGSIVDNSPHAAASGSSAAPQNVVVSISKWLNEPMAPSLQDNTKPPSSNKQSRQGRPANRSARRRR
jgi:hypothetical protein